MIKPRTLSGFMELLPEEQQKMELLLSAPVSYTHLTLPTICSV